MPISLILVPQDTQCGNFRIESDEQCDPGPTAILKDGDMCCTRDCTLKSNFTCRLVKVIHVHLELR